VNTKRRQAKRQPRSRIAATKVRAAKPGRKAAPALPCPAGAERREVEWEEF
jgi:hypothetical protein